MVLNFIWDLYNCVLFFIVELFQDSCFIEHRPCRDLLLLVTVPIFLLIIVTDWFTSLTSSLTVLIAIVSFDKLLIICLPLVPLVNNVVFSPLLAILLLLNLRLSLLLSFASSYQSPGNVHFTASNSSGEPLVKLSKTNMILLDFLSHDTSKDHLAVDK